MARDYHLTRDKIMRKIVAPQKYGCVDLICYALNVTKGV